RKQLVAKSLQFTADRNCHLMPGGIAVRQGEQHHLPSISGGVLGDAIKERIADLAGRQIQVRLPGTRDWENNVFRACLLTADHEVIGLPALESFGERRWL